MRSSNATTIASFNASVPALPTSQTPPFIDNFATNAAGAQQLSSNWQEQEGNFTITGAASAVGQASLNLATVTASARPTPTC